jgi:hypothetical protein
MNLGEINEELELHVRDAGLAAYFTTWVNAAIKEIAYDFCLPALRLKEPETVTTTESDWLYDLPATYHKNVFKAADDDWNRVAVRRSLDDLDVLDIDHDDTGELVSDVAVRDTQIGIYPMAAGTLRIWYYELPTVLSDDSDIPTCVPEEYHSRVIVSKVIVKNYHLLMDMSVNPPHLSLEWWKNNYRVGLYGNGADDIGLINCIARTKKPKRRGGICPIP